jgi:PASTA domain
MTSVPNLKGFVFFPLISSQPGKPNHKLTILSQTFTSAEFATIQGTWEGDGPNVHDGTGDITTQLFVDPTPAFARHENRVIVVPRPTLIRITFQFPNGMMSPDGTQTGWNTLTSTLTPNGTNIWHLDGTVVVRDYTGTIEQGKGPGDLSGDGSLVWTWVPPVTGEFAKEASSEVLAADLVPTFQFRPGQSLTKHSWISDQSPQADSMVAVGSTVDLDVSNTIIP